MTRSTPGWQVELHNKEEMKPTKVGEEGSIAIKVDPKPIKIFLQYYNNSETNEDFFRIWYCYTGDRYYWLISRDDDMI